jgi:hypothetical protein
MQNAVCNVGVWFYFKVFSPMVITCIFMENYSGCGIGFDDVVHFELSSSF